MIMGDHLIIKRIEVCNLIDKSFNETSTDSND